MNQPSHSSYVPWLAALATVGYFGIFMLPHRDADGDFHIRDFSRLPVIDGGRVEADGHGGSHHSDRAHPQGIVL